MANKTITDLPFVSNKDVEPKYSKEEVLDKLATAVSYSRNNYHTTQTFELELLYSLAKAFYEDRNNS